MKPIKLISYNFIFFIILVLIFEVFFGYWFSENNFGIYMRKERRINWQTKANFYGKEYNFFYKRNFWGFRGEEFDPKDIKVVFEGGSTANQRFTPENLTIVGLLNEKFEATLKKKKIYNASTDGKTVEGYVNDFLFWFPKIPEFNPEYVIFYIGVNDRYKGEKHYDQKISFKKLDQLKDYIKNNSITVDKYKTIKNKYYPTNTLSYNFDNSDLYKNFDYYNYFKAKKLYKIPSEENLIQLKRFRLRLKKLENIIDNHNYKPIFITQLMYNGLKDSNLYFINEELKKFALDNNFDLIPLDEIIQMDLYDFYDQVHTTPKGSKKIAEAIFPYLTEYLN
jgi:lysophospholipase L1-like esterase